MTSRRPPRLALAVLERFVPGSAPLAGDIVEEFDRRRSSAWVWRQVLSAVALEWSNRAGGIRPLRLVEFQPTEALERSRRMSLRFGSVNLSASPIKDAGGLGVVALAQLVTLVVPGAWWALLASVLGGCALGLGLIALRRHRRPGA
jgi:hypothetical protein